MRETESRNSKTMNLDSLTTPEFLKIMNEEDQSVPKVIATLLPKISEIVDQVVETLSTGGRLFYIGAGTSGRIGILDAVECVPTFGTPPELIQGVLAGGNGAMFQAVEGAEDSEPLGEEDLRGRNFTAKDMLIGIAASGRTPYVIGALEYAQTLGAKTVAISCNSDAEISKFAKTSLEIVVGPEVLTGSTRLKAGSAQKMVLNMITTAAMIRLGKVYSNLMVDVLPTNEKLVERGKRIIMDATGVDFETAATFFEASQMHPKVAIVMILADASFDEATVALEKTAGFVRKALEELAKK